MQAAINPDALYSFGQARKFIASSRRTDGVSLNTLHRWRVARRFTAECRVSGKRTWWFIRGSELLKLLETEVVQAEPVLRRRTPAKRERDIREAEERLSKFFGAKP